ncbi:hypothetical protein GCM10010207_09080 [Streptomyces atratus]|nr:hypothetical protein GCM10010207_09080 [Streptomyces atratus]
MGGDAEFRDMDKLCSVGETWGDVRAQSERAPRSQGTAVRYTGTMLTQGAHPGTGRRPVRSPA